METSGSRLPHLFSFKNKGRVSRVLVVALIITSLVEGCARRPPPQTGVTPPGLRSQKPYQINGIWYYPLPSAEGYVEEGLASWYGSEFHGKPTACGEPYDMFAMTAAHKTLPLGTYVKVTNLRDGRSTILRINDRGPFVAGRIIDLSCQGAQQIGGLSGVIPVRVEAVQVASEQKVGKNTYWKTDPVPSFRYGQFTIQIGAFREPSNAQRLKQIMNRTYQDVQIQSVQYGGNELYRVQVGRYADLVLAQQELQQLRQIGFADAFVVASDGR